MYIILKLYNKRILTVIAQYWVLLRDFRGKVEINLGVRTVTADRNTRRSDDSNKYEGVRQQCITEY